MNDKEVTFCTYTKSHRLFNSHVFKKVSFNEKKHDEQNCYDLSDHRFIVPYDGVYCFSAGSRISGIDKGYSGLGLFVNDALHTMIDYKVSKGGLLDLHGSASMYLLKKQSVDIRSISTNEAECYLYGKTVASFTWFSGYLVFKDE